jgi:hypothetical protein
VRVLLRIRLALSPHRDGLVTEAAAISRVRVWPLQLEKVDQSDFGDCFDPRVRRRRRPEEILYEKNAFALNTNLRDDASAARLDGGFISRRSL